MVGIVVVAARTAAAVVADIEACRSAEGPFAVAVAAAAFVAAFAAEACQSAVHPSAFARKDFVWHFVGSSESSAAAACSLAAGSLVAEQALAEMHRTNLPAGRKWLGELAWLVAAACRMAEKALAAVVAMSCRTGCYFSGQVEIAIAVQLAVSMDCWGQRLVTATFGGTGFQSVAATGVAAAVDVAVAAGAAEDIVVRTSTRRSAAEASAVHPTGS